MQLADTVKARVIGPDGRSHRVARGSRPVLRAQDRAYELLEHPALSDAATPPPGNDGAAGASVASAPSREEHANLS